MALVVLLRGVNVGGNKTFRPSALVKELSAYDAVNIGAAGTFVIRKRIARETLEREIAARLPFQAKAIICDGKDFLNLAHPFTCDPADANLVRFVTVMSERDSSCPSFPVHLPNEDEWVLSIVAAKGRILFGVYKRQMKAIRYLTQMEKLFKVPVTTRNWNTITTIKKTLDASS